MINKNHDKIEELKVMTWPLSSLWGQALKECVSEPFTKKTGIPVRHIEFTTVDFPPVLIRALEKKERPPCDVIYGNTIPAIHLAKKGFCDPLEEDEFPVLKQVSHRARPVAEGLSGWPFVIVYDVRYVMMYRDDAFPDGPPHSWEVMVAPKFKGRVSLYPGGKGFFPIAQITGGGTIEDIPYNMEPCWNFLKHLRPQVRVLEFNKKMTEHIKKGEVDIHCTVLTNIIEWKDKGYGVSWHVPKEGISSGDDALFVPAGLPEEASHMAKQYVTFSLEKDIQSSWCKRLGLCPIHRGIEKPERFINDRAYPDGPDDYEKTLFVPNSITEKYEHHLWRENFNQIFSNLS